jgi:LacI family transcriptional regulator/LacI family purine nucleotide synthesis repressor
MKDVSIRCGVSVATVSKSLNDHSDISVATKDIIRKVAKEMGYFPNSSAKALKKNCI